MVREKVDIKKISMLVKKADPKKIKKSEGGKVISKAISDVQKTSAKKESKKRPKDQYVVYTDHTKSYTKHTRHGKTI